MDKSGTIKNQIGHRSDPGRQRTENEDAYETFITSQLPQDERAGQTETAQIAIVADGIGGAVAGQRASNLAIAEMQERLKEPSKTPISERIADALLHANQAVYNESMADPSLSGMGTTAVVAAILGDQLYLAHAGDSRAYLVRGQHIYRLTIDHTWVQEALEVERLTREAAAAHPNRHVIKRYLGIREHVEPDLRIVKPGADVTDPERKVVSDLSLEEGDHIVLCSDGLTDVVADEEIQRVVSANPPQKAAEKLVDLANEGGGPDNITVVILAHVQEPEVPALALWLPRAGLAVGALLLVGLVALLFSRMNDSQPASADQETVVTALGEDGRATSTAQAEPDRTEELSIVPTEMQSSMPTPTETETPMSFATPVPMAPTSTNTPVPTPTWTNTPTSTSIEPSTTVTETIATSTAVSDPTTSTSPLGEHIAQSAGDSASSSIDSVGIELLEPINQYKVRSGELIKFRWQTGYKLSANETFEVVLWQPDLDETAMVNSKGVADVAKSDGRPKNIAEGEWALEIFFPENVFSAGHYEWGVLVVQIEPYQRKAFLGEQREISVGSPSGGGSDCSTNPDACKE